MLLVLLLFALPCLFPLNVVLGMLAMIFAFPLVAVVLIIMGLMLQPPSKSTLIIRLEAQREAEERERQRNPSTTWFDGRHSRTRPWENLPQWDRGMVCESGRRSSQNPVKRAALRAALRAESINPTRH